MDRAGIQFVPLLLLVWVCGVVQASADTTGSSNNTPRSTGFFRSSLDALSNKRSQENDARKQVVQSYNMSSLSENKDASIRRSSAEKAESIRRGLAEKTESIRRGLAEKAEYERRSLAEKAKYDR